MCSCDRCRARGRIIGALHEFSPGPIEEGTDLSEIATNILASLTADGAITLRAEPCEQYDLIVNGRMAGRFSSLRGAEMEGERLYRIAAKRGDRCEWITSIVRL